MSGSDLHKCVTDMSGLTGSHDNTHHRNEICARYDMRAMNYDMRAMNYDMRIQKYAQ